MTECHFTGIIFRTVLTTFLWSATFNHLSADSGAATSSAVAASRGVPDSRCGVDNGIVVDTSDCRGYLLCLQGAARPLRCSRDLLFHPTTLLCDYPGHVQCGTRPVTSASLTGGWPPPADVNRCFSAFINVTIEIKNELRAPLFRERITVRVQRQPLRYVLLIAAGMNPKFRFQTTEFPGFGDYLSSINGVGNDFQQYLAIWTLYDNRGSIVRENLSVLSGSRDTRLSASGSIPSASSGLKASPQTTDCGNCHTQCMCHDAKAVSSLQSSDGFSRSVAFSLGILLLLKGCLSGSVRPSAIIASGW